MRNVYGWSLAAVFCMLSISVAQVRTQPAQPGTRPAAGAVPPAATAQAAANPDQQIADLIRGGAQNEVALAKFAQEKAKSDSVKEFAATMIKEHSQQVEKLAKFAGAGGGDTARGETRTETRRDVRKVPGDDDATDNREEKNDRREKAGDKAGDRREKAADRAEDRRDDAREDRREVREERRDTTRTTTAAGQRGGFNWVTIHKEIGEQCLKSTKEELGRYKGDDFDKAYMGQQIVAHMQMIDKLTVLKNHASSELAQQLETDLNTAEEHLNHAREIMKEQKDQGSSGGKDGRKEGSKNSDR